MALVSCLAACGSLADGPATGQASEAILNGTSVLNNTLGVVEVRTSKGNCSGTLLSDRWVLTAQHCLTGVNVQQGQTGTLAPSASVLFPTTGGATASQSGMFLHPTLDVALLYINLSYINPATGAPFSNPLYLGSASGLVGQTVLCEGYGNPGFGTLRSANLLLSQMDGADFRVPRNAGGQTIASGDSGGPCFVYTGGGYSVIGVASTGAPPPDTFAYADEVAVENFRDWAEGIMGNAVTVFSGNGFTGASEQLLPGGPLEPPFGGGLFDNYDLPMLTIGNDNIRSWLVPPSPWFTELFVNSGFQGAVTTGGIAVAGTTFSPTGVAMQSGLAANTSSAGVAGYSTLYGNSDFTFDLYHVALASTVTVPVQGNAVNSLTVPSGWTATFFNGGFPENHTYTFTEGSYGTVPAPFNNLLAGSTITFREPAALYVDGNYGNKVSRLLPDCYDVSRLGIPDNSVSSVFVPEGLAVQLFKNPGFSGGTELLTSSQSNVGSAWNDATSSVCVYARPIGCGMMLPGQALLPGQGVSSCDGRFFFVMQTDGNLVLYFGSVPLWATSTNGLGGQNVVMRNDGNFVLYDTNFHVLTGGVYGPAQTNTSAPVGTVPSNTAGNTGAYLLIQDDGNVVVYSSSATALWATNTCCH